MNRTPIALLVVALATIACSLLRSSPDNAVGRTVELPGALEPPQPPEVEYSDDALKAQYAGRIELVYSYVQRQQTLEARMVRDVWLITNPTTQAVAPQLVLKFRDTDGYLLWQREEHESCASYAGSLHSLENNVLIIPPGQTIIYAYDYVGDPEPSPPELQVRTLEGCPEAARYGIHYDPDVQLMSLQRSGRSLDVVIENAGQRNARGIIFANIFRPDGTPLYRLRLTDRLGGIPPSEKVRRSLDFDYGWFAVLVDPGDPIDPESFEYEFVWVGLSE